MNRRALSMLGGLSAIGWLAAAPGCKHCDEDRPPLPDAADGAPIHLREGRFLDGATVELTFSRALAPVDGVDPAKFRLSVGRGEVYDYARGCSSSTDYCDPSLGLRESGCDYCSYGYSAPQACPPPTRVTALLHDATAPEQLQLTIEPPITPLICLQLEYADDDAAILVHFSKLDIPTITDVDGTALDDIAPHWVLNTERDSYEDGIFGARDAWVPIPCPEDF